MSTPSDPNLVSNDRLEDLEEEIDDIAKRVDDPLDQGENTFINGDPDGNDRHLRVDAPEDDTIVPPG